MLVNHQRSQSKAEKLGEALDKPKVDVDERHGLFYFSMPLIGQNSNTWLSKIESLHLHTPHNSAHHDATSANRRRSNPSPLNNSVIAVEESGL
jgi:hypothetical protein